MKKIVLGLSILLSFVISNNVFAVGTSKTINSVLLNGSTSTTVSTNTSFTVSVNVTSQSASAERWLSTKYQVGSLSAVCVDTANHSGDTDTESFFITSPSSIGNYDFKIWIYSDNSCTDDQVGPYTLTNGLVVSAPDTTAPTGTISINDGATYTNSSGVVLTLSATDPSGVTQMAFSNGGAYSEWEAYATSKVWTLSAGDGSKTVRVRYVDSLGNGISTTGIPDTIILDTTSPTVSITNISEGQYLKGIKTIEASAGDSSGISKVEFWHASIGTKIGEDTSEPYSIDWDTTLVSDGSHDVWVRAYDNAGNYLNSDSIGVVIDNTAPTISVDSPLITNDTTPTITGNTNDTAKIYVTVGSLNPYEVTPIGTSWSFTISPEDALADGEYTISISSTDQAGNTGTGGGSLKVDTLAPSLTVVSPLPYNATSIYGTTDKDASVNVNANGSDYTAVVDPSTGDWMLSIPTLPDGSYDLAVTATDTANNTTAQIHRTLIVDTVNPSITSITITSPSTIEVLMSEDIQNNEDGHHPQISDFIVFNNNTSVEYGVSSVTYSNKVVTINLTNPIVSGDDPYITVYPGIPTSLVDLAGNDFNSGNTDTREIVLDTITPQITLLGESSIRIKKNTTYTDSGAAASDIIDGDVTSSIVVSNNVNTAFSGNYYVKYNVTDSNGNIADEITRTVIVYSSGRRTTGSGSTGEVLGAETSFEEEHSFEDTSTTTEELVLGEVSTTTENALSTSTATSTGEVLGIQKFVFSIDMGFGSRVDPDVTELQKVLMSEGLLKISTTTGIFGRLTKEAVIKYQEKYKDEILTPLGLTKGTGFVGPYTRAKLNQ